MVIFNSYVKLPEGNDGGMTIYGMTIPENLTMGWFLSGQPCIPSNLVWF